MTTHTTYGRADKATPALAATALEKLASLDDVRMVFGSWASSCALAEAPIAERKGIPILVEAQSPKIRDAGDYVFRIQPDSRYYLSFLAPYAVKELGLRSFSILYVNNDYGIDQAQVFTRLVEGMGGKVLSSEGFAQGETDFRTALAKIKKLGPDAVFIPAYAEAGYVMRQASELDMHPQFLGSAPMENPDLLSVAGRAAEGLIYVHHFDPERQDPDVVRFRRAYREKYGSEPEGYAALAYDAAYVIAHVLLQCGGPECNRSEIKKLLYGVKDLPGVTGPTSFDDHGDVIKPIVIRTVKDGRFVTIKTLDPSQQVPLGDK